MSAGTGTDIKKFNSSSSIWGSITGNILNQLDLINYINTPRVINQAGGANITFDSRITDLVVLDANQDFLINYPITPGSKDGQIVVLDIYCSDGLNHNITLPILFNKYDGVIAETVANNLYITTFVFKYSELTDIWFLYNCGKAIK